MPSVRKAPLFNEIGAHRDTYYYNNTIVYDPSDIATDSHSAQIGMAVTLVSDSTVGLGASGGLFRGAVIVVESDGSCTVQDGGVVKVPYLVGAPPIIGRGVTVDGAGNVTSASGGATAAESVYGACVLSLDATNLVAYVLLPF